MYVVTVVECIIHVHLYIPQHTNLQYLLYSTFKQTNKTFCLQIQVLVYVLLLASARSFFLLRNPHLLEVRMNLMQEKG